MFPITDASRADDRGLRRRRAAWLLAGIMPVPAANGRSRLVTLSCAGSITLIAQRDRADRASMSARGGGSHSDPVDIDASGSGDISIKADHIGPLVTAMHGAGDVSAQAAIDNPLAAGSVAEQHHAGERHDPAGSWALYRLT